MKPKWPVLSYEKGKSTYETLQLWTQIVGKIKLATLPWVNHSWNVTLHITPTGLSTQTIPYQGQHFQIDFDFIVHRLKITSTKGQTKQFALNNLSVADFYKKTFGLLEELEIDLTINTLPCEIFGKIIPFELDTEHAGYDPNQASAFHQALLNIQDVFMVFRTRFTGKASPIHFFWGGFDLSLAFFSGHKAPKHPGKVPGLPDWVLQDSYSNEVSDAGFWTGSETLPEAAFYCYLYPEPEVYKNAYVSPAEAYYNQTLGEFILPYTSVQEAVDPAAKLLEFLESTYAIGSESAKWSQDLYKQEVKL